MKKIVISTALASIFTSPLIYAQTTPAPVVDGALDFSGYVDVSYNYLSQSNSFSGGSYSRVFDLERNGLAVQQAAFTLAKLPSAGLGGLLNLTAGKDADIINSYGLGYGKKNKFDVTQAFVQYASGPVTVMGGKFVTLAGAEVIKSTANPNFSRSILFGYAIPFAHTGLRATYAADETLSLMLGANNGWDDFRDTNSAKTLELGVSYTPSKMASFGAQGYFGKERVGGLVDTGPEGSRNLVDLVATFNVSDQLTLIANYDYGTQANATLASGSNGTAKWSGIAGYANYQINQQWRLSGRAEYFDDRDGYRTGVVQKWKEATLTLAYLPTAALELRAEVRADLSSAAAFMNAAGTSARRSQQSVGLQALYKF